MGTKVAQRYCPHDKRMVLATKQTPNHILHLILTAITGGLWAIVWFILAVIASERPWRCPDCGGKTLRTAQAAIPVNPVKLNWTRVAIVAVAVILVIGLASMRHGA